MEESNAYVRHAIEKQESHTLFPPYLVHFAWVCSGGCRNFQRGVQASKAAHSQAWPTLGGSEGMLPQESFVI